jgi:hypothetical protein
LKWASSLAAPVFWFIDAGTSNYSETVARRLRVVNRLAGASAFLGVFFTIRYSLIDWRGLLPFSLCALGGTVVWLLTPWFHRLGETSAIIYLICVTIVVFLTFGYVAGSGTGIQYFLLAAPAALLAVGSNRVQTALVLTAAMTVAFGIMEFALPETSPS